MRAVVFAGAGGNEVIRLEERPDPVPGSEELLVRVTYAGLNPADISQRDGSYPAPPGSPQDVPGLEVSGTVEAVGAQVLGWQPGDRVFGLVGGGGLADRVVVARAACGAGARRARRAGAAAMPEAFITAHDAIRSQAALSAGRDAARARCRGRGGQRRRADRGRVRYARARHGAQRRGGRARAASSAASPTPDEGSPTACWRRLTGAAPTSSWSSVGAPHFPDNLRAVAVLGRIVIVGLGAGAEVALVLRQLMARRASIRGTVLRARPLEQKAQALRAFERELIPHTRRAAV